MNKHFENYKEKVFNCVGNEYELIDLYSKNKKTILVLLHNECGNIYEVEQYKFLHNKNRCNNYTCKSNRHRAIKLKTTEQFKSEVFDLVGDEYIVLDEYIGKDEPLLFYHKECNGTFYKSPHNFLAGQRCIHCVQPTTGEQVIIDYCKLHNIKYIFQKSYHDLVGTNGGELSYDFYIPAFNLLIEYQGQFHDGTAYKMFPEKLKKQKEHDKRKREYAEIHNINLLEIWYYDFDNIYEILDKYINDLKVQQYE